MSFHDSNLGGLCLQPPCPRCRRYAVVADAPPPGVEPGDLDAVIRRASGTIRATCGSCGERFTIGSADQAGVYVLRTVYATGGLGDHQASIINPPEVMTGPWQRVHQARVTVPAVYEELTGTNTEIEPGIQAQYAINPVSQDKKPVLYQFDATKFSEDQARQWLSQRLLSSEYVFLPDEGSRTPVTQGTPSSPNETPPEGFEDLTSFYDATLPLDGTTRANPIPTDSPQYVQHAGGRTR